MNQVFKTKTAKTPLTETQLKEIAGNWFTIDRIEGNLCNCEPNQGEFVLLSKKHPAVVEGGKDYMECRICGGYSHL